MALGGHFRHPAPINQFYRLEYDEVAKVYVKADRWGTAFDNANCMAAAGAVGIDAHSGGNHRSTPPQIRRNQDDQSGGIGVDDVDVAWHRIWGDDLLTPGDFDWNDLMHAVRQGRNVIVGVDYRKVPDQYKLQVPGDFDHGLNVDDYRSDGSILRYDSLGTNPAWVPQLAVRPAAEALALRVRGSKAKLFVGLSAIRPPVYTQYHVVIPKGSDYGLYIVQNGVIVDTKIAHTSKGFGPVTADHRGTYPWPPNHPRQDLVRITEGSIYNNYHGTAYVRYGWTTESK